MKILNSLKKIELVIVNIFVIMISASCIFPVIWVLYSSMKTSKEFNLSIISLPSRINFSNYSAAIKHGNLDKYFLNSLFNTCITVFVIIILSFMIGYCLSRFKFRGRKLIYIMFLAGMLIPVHSLLVPIFIEFKTIGLRDTRFTLLFPYVAFGLPMAIFLFESFVKSVPVEIEEAACIDGSSLIRTIIQIIMPICRPVISTVVILSFLQWWNEFSFALVLINDDAYKTIPLGLANFIGPLSGNYTELMAAITIAIMPVLIVYIAFYKKIIQGMVMGAVKG